MKPDPAPMALNNMPAPRIGRAQYHSARYRSFGLPRRERGIVLIIALIMLGLISILAITSFRNASTSESVSGNVRTTELGSQSAEIALRHCEASVLAMLSNASGAPTSYVTTFSASNILPFTTPAQWQNTGNWDSASSAAYVLPLTMVNQPGLATTYKRPPECMVEALPVMPAGAGSVVNSSRSFVVTARGFGPDVVAASANRSRPVGSEIWMQSQIDVQ